MSESLYTQLSLCRTTGTCPVLYPTLLTIVVLKYGDWKSLMDIHQKTEIDHFYETKIFFPEKWNQLFSAEEYKYNYSNVYSFKECIIKSKELKYLIYVKYTMYIIHYTHYTQIHYKHF